MPKSPYFAFFASAVGSFNRAKTAADEQFKNNETGSPRERFIVARIVTAFHGARVSIDIIYSFSAAEAAPTRR